MTCIVAITDGKKVYMGGDSQGTALHTGQLMKNEKVFKKTFSIKKKNSIKEVEMLFGCSNSIRMTQIIHYIFDIPEMDGEMDERPYMVKVFVPALIKCFADNGYLRTQEGEISNCYFMCGFNGRLFTLQDDFQVGEPMLNYDSIGSGADYAMGALSASFEYHDTDYVNVLRIALEIAAKHNITVSGPFNIMSV